MQKGFTAIYVGILLVILAALGGAYYLGRSSIKQPAIQPQVTVMPTSASLPTSNGASNWKTYTNSKYGLSIRYPTSLTFIDEKLETGSENKDWYTINWSVKNQAGFIAITIMPNAKNIKGEFITEKNFDSLYRGNAEQITLQGRNGRKLKDPENPSTSGSIIYYYLDGKNVFYINGSTNNIKDFSYEDIDQVLSTFKFLDTNIQD